MSKMTTHATNIDHLLYDCVPEAREVQVAVGLLRDEHISLAAKGLMMMLSAQTQGVGMPNLILSHADEEQGKLIDELEEWGYIFSYEWRNKTTNGLSYGIYVTHKQWFFDITTVRALAKQENCMLIECGVTHVQK